MKNHRFNLSIAAVFALTVLFIPIGDAFAQTQLPIFADDIVASIEVGNEVKVVPVTLQNELEQAYGVSATVSPLSQVIASLAPAGTGATLHCEGGWPEGAAVADLEAKGYTVTTVVPTSLPSAGVASKLSN